MGKGRRNKSEQQKLVKAAGLRSTREARGTVLADVREFLQKEPMPCIVKPTESCGSDGVKKCSTVEEAEAHFELLMRSQKMQAHKIVLSFAKSSWQVKSMLLTMSVVMANTSVSWCGCMINAQLMVENLFITTCCQWNHRIPLLRHSLPTRKESLMHLISSMVQPMLR